MRLFQIACNRKHRNRSDCRPQNPVQEERAYGISEQIQVHIIREHSAGPETVRNIQILEKRKEIGSGNLRIEQTLR